MSPEPSHLACASGCTLRGHHLSACPCADPHHEHAEPTTAQYNGPLSETPGWSCHWCTGCLPRLAAHRLQVCHGCDRAAREALAELPDLWVDLAERPRLAGVSKAPTTEGDTPDPMSDARRDARSAIKAMLVFWCVILEETHGINVPDEAQIAATTRSLAVWHSDKARDARDEGDRDEAPRHAQAAAAARDDRETGRDILRAICEHITRHLDTLLATDDAEQLVSQVKGARYDARGKAYPVAPEGVTIPCPACGERSRVKPDTKDDITCPRCGATGDTAWWGGDAQREPLTLTQLRGYLANGGLYATDRQLRSWADKGILRTLRPGRAPDGRMQDRLFDPLASITAVAEHLAKKRHERRAA